MKKRSNSYWERRARSRMASYHRAADSVVNLITAAYDKAKQDITDNIERIFAKFVLDSRFTPAEAINVLNTPVNDNEWLRMKEKLKQIKDPTIQRELLKRLNASAYRARLTRLQALQEHIYIQCKRLADVEIQASRTGYMSTIKNAYYRTLYDIQRGLNIGFAFASMPSRVIQAIIKHPWSGRHFSKRIWDNTDLLAKQLPKIVTAALMSGASNSKLVAELAKCMDVGKLAANRLIRTELTYMANAAEMESYKEGGVDKYVFVATLDKRTSAKCRQHDLKVYKVSEAVTGKNLPPLHPYCRSTTRAHLGSDTLQNITRRARDPTTGKSYTVPANMTYQQWHNTFCNR